MDYTIESIQTIYKERNYRSRLEAKWAAFFDLCGWRYEYEPLDLNGWFPDFALYGDKGNRILVEVKPLVSFSENVAAKIQGAAEAACMTENELLLLGEGPFRNEYGQWRIGWLLDLQSWVEGDDPVEFNEWAEAAWGQWKEADKPGFCHEWGEYFDRISRLYDGGSYGAGDPPDPEHLWAKAANLIQWKP